MTQNNEEIFIQTKAKNGLKVRIPASKLEEFKKSQDNPDEKAIKEFQKKMLEGMDIKNLKF